MTRVLVISDDGIASGYGRISMECNTRLVKRGYTIHAASLQYDGLLPPTNDGVPLPYWVSALGGKSTWVEAVVNLIAVTNPDIVHVCQDAPYAQALYYAPVDWSRRAFVVTTPVDGIPVFPAWVDVMRQADGLLVLSQFGVDAYRAAGVDARQCKPGVDPNTFFPRPPEQRAELRAKLGLPADTFLVGTCAMNQGRKAISTMLRAFFRMAASVPNARYLLDMDAVSPAGWDIPALCQQYGWDATKLLFRQQAAQAGLSLPERMAIMDAHMVISHREGYGLPLVEAMACGAVSLALDYCSGPEIVGGGRGVLIPTNGTTEPGTWGGALDHYPDEDALVNALVRLYEEPGTRAQIAAAGTAWARSQSWDEAADSVQALYERALAKRKAAAA